MTALEDQTTREFLIAMFLAFEASFLGWVQPRIANVILNPVIVQYKEYSRQDNVLLVEYVIYAVERINDFFSGMNVFCKILNILTLTCIPILVICQYLEFGASGLLNYQPCFIWGKWYIIIKSVYYIIQLGLVPVLAFVVSLAITKPKISNSITIISPEEFAVQSTSIKPRQTKPRNRNSAKHTPQTT